MNPAKTFLNHPFLVDSAGNSSPMQIASPAVTSPGPSITDIFARPDFQYGRALIGTIDEGPANAQDQPAYAMWASAQRKASGLKNSDGSDAHDDIGQRTAPPTPTEGTTQAQPSRQQLYALTNLLQIAYQNTDSLLLSQSRIIKQSTAAGQTMELYFWLAPQEQQHIRVDAETIHSIGSGDMSKKPIQTMATFVYHFYRQYFIENPQHEWAYVLAEAVANATDRIAGSRTAWLPTQSETETPASSPLVELSRAKELAGQLPPQYSSALWMVQSLFGEEAILKLLEPAQARQYMYIPGEMSEIPAKPPQPEPELALELKKAAKKIRIPNSALQELVFTGLDHIFDIKDQVAANNLASPIELPIDYGHKTTTYALTRSRLAKLNDGTLTFGVLRKIAQGVHQGLTKFLQDDPENASTRELTDSLAAAMDEDYGHRLAWENSLFALRNMTLDDFERMGGDELTQAKETGQPLYFFGMHTTTGELSKNTAVSRTPPYKTRQIGFFRIALQWKDDKWQIMVTRGSSGKDIAKILVANDIAAAQLAAEPKTPAKQQRQIFLDQPFIQQILQLRRIREQPDTLEEDDLAVLVMTMDRDLLSQAQTEAKSAWVYQRHDDPDNYVVSLEQPTKLNKELDHSVRLTGTGKALIVDEVFGYQSSRLANTLIKMGLAHAASDGQTTFKPTVFHAKKNEKYITPKYQEFSYEQTEANFLKISRFMGQHDDQIKKMLNDFWAQSGKNTAWGLVLAWNLTETIKQVLHKRDHTIVDIIQFIRQMLTLATTLSQVTDESRLQLVTEAVLILGTDHSIGLETYGEILTELAKEDTLNDTAKLRAYHYMIHHFYHLGKGWRTKSLKLLKGDPSIDKDEEDLLLLFRYFYEMSIDISYHPIIIWLQQNNVASWQDTFQISD